MMDAYKRANEALHPPASAVERVVRRAAAGARPRKKRRPLWGGAFFARTGQTNPPKGPFPRGGESRETVIPVKWPPNGGKNPHGHLSPEKGNARNPSTPAPDSGYPARKEAPQPLRADEGRPDRGSHAQDKRSPPVSPPKAPGCASRPPASIRKHRHRPGKPRKSPFPKAKDKHCRCVPGKLLPVVFLLQKPRQPIFRADG